MATRFSDDLHNNTDASDFIVRRRIPLTAQIFMVFAIAFLAIYTTGNIMKDTGSRTLFCITLALTIGSLSWCCAYFSARLRDLVLATEFQNAMLASAAQLSTRFCLIAKRDGTIVYIDPGFQIIFPHFRQSSDHNIEGLMSSAGISREQVQQIILILQQNKNDRILLALKRETGEIFQTMVSIDVLPRPKGYFLLRGRDYVEKRSTDTETPAMTSGSALAHALNALPEGILTVDGSGTVTYANLALEEWLGFAPGELLARPYNKVGHILYQYAGNDAGRIISGNFEGEIILQRKDRGLITMHIVQSSLGKTAGSSAIIRLKSGVSRL